MTKKGGNCGGRNTNGGMAAIVGTLWTLLLIAAIHLMIFAYIGEDTPVLEYFIPGIICCVLVGLGIIIVALYLILRSQHIDPALALLKMTGMAPTATGTAVTTTNASMSTTPADVTIPTPTETPTDGPSMGAEYEMQVVGQHGGEMD